MRKINYFIIFMVAFSLLTVKKMYSVGEKDIYKVFVAYESGPIDRRDKPEYLVAIGNGLTDEWKHVNQMTTHSLTTRGQIDPYEFAFKLELSLNQGGISAEEVSDFFMGRTGWDQDEDTDFIQTILNQSLTVPE